MDNTNNKQYWNDYVSYWENKVEEANTEKKTPNITSDDIILETYFNKIKLDGTDVILDYGCGSGRLYPIYNKAKSKKDNYYGIDISKVSLEHAQKKYEGLELGRNLKEFDGLHIPFEDSSFDKIVCFGVFDACIQEVIIKELFRVLKPEGILLLTGKNDKYCDDDKEAIIAEINSRKKGHPNYFTNLPELMKQLKEHNVEIAETYYFLYRGDFPQNKVILEMPEVFYEWALLLRKTKQYKDYDYIKFSDEFSVILK